jgi:hypothetical protein
VADTLALEKLFDDVVARFTAEGVAVPNTFGWREPPRHGPTSRICWVPGDPTGSAGEDAPPKYPGRNPRPLATLRELFTVYITGADLTPNLKESERAQWKATRLLYDVWRRAVYLAAYGTMTIREVRWAVDHNERRYGATLIVVSSLEAMIPDTEQTSAPIDTAAHITPKLDSNGDPPNPTSDVVIIVPAP